MQILDYAASASSVRCVAACAEESTTNEDVKYLLADELSPHSCTDSDFTLVSTQ
jgi:hypothetical protein